MTETPAVAGDDISEETRMLVARVRQRAAQAPSAEEIARLLTAAPRENVTTEDVRRIGEQAISTVQQYSYLLGVLAAKYPAGGV